ncbi:MAG: cysteine desulfurase family protein [Phycisphaerales bacterium]
MIYLDNNATTRPAPEVVAAMREALETGWHNPSSVHRPGQEARRRVELARAAVAGLISANPREITFTSGGTEAIDLAIRGTLAGSRKRRLLTTAVEHAAVRDLAWHMARATGIEVVSIPLDRRGVVRLETVESLIDDSLALVSVQWANNETGAIQPIEEIATLCRSRGVPFHCDATQLVGKMPLHVGIGVVPDLLTFSPHKFHGPKGVGVLWARAGTRIVPLLRGVQERERRGGTENVPGIVGAGVAAALASAWLADPRGRDAVAELRDRFEQGVLAAVPGTLINGPIEPHTRLPNTTNIAFPRLEAEALLLAMSERGLAASAGAACSSGSLDPSPVLLAMGVPPELAHGSVRFSLSRETTADEVTSAIEVVGICARRVSASMA